MPSYVISDELRLSQVITNLMSNAVKFTPDHGNVTLNIQKGEIDGDNFTLHCEVTDTGIGISEENIKKLFKSFEQAESGITRKFGGTGLGLAISKKIVDLMGGSIIITSELGKGSCFSFDVKLQEDKNAVSKNVFDKSIYNSVRILVIDDDLVILDYFKKIMDSFGIYCDQVSSGAEAVDTVRNSLHHKTPYNIIFVDYLMEGMDGMETTRKIKLLADDSVNVIMISISDWTLIEKEAAEAGIVRFIQKPLFQSAILNTINELVIDKNALLVQKPNQSSDVTTFSKCRLLLVEDIDINCEIVISLLEDTKIIIECAADGKKAVEMFAENQDLYDIILMDVQMPVMDGLMATEQIRSLKTKQALSVPIIAMTANAFKEDVEICKKAGMNDHVSKPIDFSVLIDKIEKYLKGKED